GRWSDGSGEATAMVVVRGVAAAVARGEVAARDIVDRVDRATRRHFGFAEKSPPEKFSGGGWWWPTVETWPAVER
nr:hypothetical protein [Tanacetum cinerariifolium]